MSERPILFSGPMVRALLDGRKTQTRRIVKHQPIKGDVYATKDDGVWGAQTERSVVTYFSSPYGLPGDRLWVRETWAVNKYYDGRPANKCGPIPEVAVECRELPDAVRVLPSLAHRSIGEERGKWRPSIFMPRWASRITLQIEGVRVERLHDIGKDGRKGKDVMAEGITEEQIGAWRQWLHPDDAPAHTYGVLWDSINGKGSWVANPWVWVVTFNLCRTEQPLNSGKMT